MRGITQNRCLGLVLVVALLGLNPAARGDNHRSRKYTPPPPTSDIHITVLRGTNGKPVPDAAVILHPIRDGKDEGALELKSDLNGKAAINVIPVGDTVRLQIIASGWQTYGEDYQIDADKKDIVVKLKRPVPQHSLYTANGVTDQNNRTPQGKTTNAKPSGQTPIPQ
jgi:hypothetical protein